MTLNLSVCQDWGPVRLLFLAVAPPPLTHTFQVYSVCGIPVWSINATHLLTLKLFAKQGI